MLKIEVAVRRPRLVRAPRVGALFVRMGSIRGSMVLGLRGQNHAPCRGIGQCFAMRDINRPIERQRDLGEHGAQFPFGAVPPPECRRISPGTNELEIIAVGHFVFRYGESRDMSLVLLEFVIPPKAGISPLAERSVAGRYLNPLRRRSISPAERLHPRSTLVLQR